MSNLIPEGRYKAVVHDFGTGASNTKGTSYLRLGLRILEGDCAGRIIDAMLWITDKTRPRVATDLVAIGYDSDEDPLAAFGNAKTLEQVPCAARPVQIVVKHEEFNGRVDARVAYINALSKEAPRATAESRAAWKDAFSKARQGSGRERAPAPQPIEDAPFLPRPIPPSRPGGLGKPRPRARGVMNEYMKSVVDSIEAIAKQRDDARAEAERLKAERDKARVGIALLREELGLGLSDMTQRTADLAREVIDLRRERDAMRAAIKAAVDARDAFKPGEAQNFDAALEADRVAMDALRTLLEVKP